MKAMVAVGRDSGRCCSRIGHTSLGSVRDRSRGPEVVVE